MIGSDEPFLYEIEKILNTIRPHIQKDGGDVTIIKCVDDILYVRLEGACVECPVSEYTFRYGIQEVVKKHFPEIKKVILVDNE